MVQDLSKMKKEFVFYYESRQNPNGDPGFENQPRLMPDGTILVTDVRIKRTIRDYAKQKLGKTLFVDYDKDGNACTADERASAILGDMSGDVIEGLINKTYDTPLFGALVTLRKGEKGEGSSNKLTGPVQFGIGRSVNKVKIINPMITGRFVGKKKDNSEEQFSTFGKFYSVEYALIKIQGVVNPTNLDKYLANPDSVKKFIDAEGMMFECLWNGTNSLISRSKFPQRSVFYMEVEYNSAVYNDLPLLINESECMHGQATQLCEKPLSFDKAIAALIARKPRIAAVRVASCRDLFADSEALVKKLCDNGIPASLIPTEEPKW
jgi:CRISPR-associated protein Csh2